MIGRICELLTLFGEDTTDLEFGIKWESMELGGARQPLDLKVESAVPGTAKADSVSASPHARGFPSAETHAGYFLISGVRKNYRIPAGFESVWVTTPAAPISK